MTKAIATTPQAGCLPPEVQIAQQLTDQYRKAVAGTREILIFGAMMMQLPNVLELQNDTYGGSSAKGLGLKGWIEEHCPTINYKTAHGFFSLARGMRETLAIPATTDVHRLLTAAPADLKPRERKLRELLDGAIDGKSAHQLEFDFGIRKARTALPASGGAREGAGRPAKSLTREQAQLEAFFSKEAIGTLGVNVLEKRWHLRLDDERKEALLAIAEQLVRDLGGGHS